MILFDWLAIGTVITVFVIVAAVDALEKGHGGLGAFIAALIALFVSPFVLLVFFSLVWLAVRVVRLTWGI